MTIMTAVHMTENSAGVTRGVPEARSTLVSIIVTHYNYSRYVRTAIESALAQTHVSVEVIIVDDLSDAPHRAALRAIVKDIADARVALVELPHNKGQINAVFEGLAVARGEFVALLDPDDIYEPRFVERMLDCHLNSIVFAPVATCEMGMFRIGGGVLARTYVGYRYKAFTGGTLPRAEATLADFGFTAYYPPEHNGWLWATTSAMMFRRDALVFLRRNAYMEHVRHFADAYCAYGAHMLGGTLLIDEMLSWRGLHDANTAESEHVIGLHQHRHRPDFEDVTHQVKLFVIGTLLENGARAVWRDHKLAEMLRGQFVSEDIALLTAQHPFLEEVMKLAPPLPPAPDI